MSRKVLAALMRLNTNLTPAVAGLYGKLSKSKAAIRSPKVSPANLRARGCHWQSSCESDGTWRFCVDYKKLDTASKNDVHSHPRVDNVLEMLQGPCFFTALGRVDDVLEMLQGSCFFTTSGMTSGYWQVP